FFMEPPWGNGIIDRLSRASCGKTCGKSGSKSLDFLQQPGYLAKRHGLPPELISNIAAIEGLAAQAGARSTPSLCARAIRCSALSMRRDHRVSGSGSKTISALPLNTRQKP